MYNRVAGTKRQKVLIILTLITFMVLIWQIYTLVHSDLSPDAHKSTITAHPSSAPSQPIPAITAANNTTTPVTSLAMTTNTSVPVVAHDDTPQTVNELPAQIYQSRNELAPNQQEYMRYSREFELAKMERRLLEEKVAIANARKSIADTEQQTHRLSGHTGDNLDFNRNTWRLTFLSRHNHKWHATIQHNGDYHNVVVGTKLLNGTKILQIDKSGVEFEYHGIIKKLNFAGVKTVSGQATTSATLDSHLDTATRISTLQTPPMSENATQNTSLVHDSGPNLLLAPASKTPAVPASALPNYHAQESLPTVQSNASATH